MGIFISMDPNILAQLAQQSGQPAPQEPPLDPMDAESKIIIQALIKRLQDNSKAREMGFGMPQQPMM